MEVDATIHPQPLPDCHHRKIELQTPQDLTYLQSNLIVAAKAKLDLHFPPSALQSDALLRAQPATVIPLGLASETQPDLRDSQPLDQEQPAEQRDNQEDPLRARVRALVDAFMARTWAGASQNITVNGIEAAALPSMFPSPGADVKLGDAEGVGEREGIDFQYEACDGRLQSQVTALYGELESLTAQVSRLRRTAPQAGASLLNDRLRAQLEQDEADHEKRSAQIRDELPGADGLSGLGQLEDGWSDNVQRIFAHGTGELLGLVGLETAEEPSSTRGASLTETVGKVQRARTVATEFE